MNHSQVNWGRPRDDVYGPYDNRIHSASLDAVAPKVHTQQPTVTGSSVIGIKFDKGVMLAADNLASYGSLARFTNEERLIRVGDETIVGFGGDVSDMQYIERLLEDLEISENYDNEDGRLRLGAKHVFSYLSKTMYARRNKMDPLWNAILVAGFDDEGSPFLSYTDLLGVTYSSPTLATGFGAYLAIPLLRKAVEKEGDEKNLTESEARALIDKCMKVLFYRDARSLDKYTVATVTKQGVKFDKNVKCEDMNWRFAKDIRGYGNQKV